MRKTHRNLKNGEKVLDIGTSSMLDLLSASDESRNNNFAVPVSQAARKTCTFYGSIGAGR